MQTHNHDKKQTMFLAGLVRAAQLCIGFAAIMLVSCDVTGLLNLESSLSGGSITLSVDTATARTLTPSYDMNIASYAITGTGPNGATFTATSSTTTYTATKLARGSWTVTVNGLNAAGSIVGAGTATVSVETGKTASVSVIVAPIAGNGTLAVTLTWPAALVSTPQVVASLTGTTGTVTPLSFSTPASGTSTYTGTVANGYYTLSVQLLDNGQLVMGSVEIARIVAGQTTTGTYNYTSINVGNGSILVNITPAVSNPIPVTIAGAVATVATGTPVNLTASVPSGNTVTYVWYVNGASVATGATYALNPAATPLSPGSYRVDCVALSTNGQSAGDATFFVNVTAATSVALTWDASTSTNVAGYKLYVGMTSGTYGSPIDVGNSLTYTVTGLAKGVTYYFAATAYNATGRERIFERDQLEKQLSKAGRAAAPGALPPYWLQMMYHPLLGSAVESSDEWSGDVWPAWSVAVTAKSHSPLPIVDRATVQDGWGLAGTVPRTIHVLVPCAL